MLILFTSINVMMILVYRPAFHRCPRIYISISRFVDRAITRLADKAQMKTVYEHV